jgi:hypothetical protein
MTMRYVNTTAEQKRLAIERFEKFRAGGLINAATSRQCRGIRAEATALERLP